MKAIHFIVLLALLFLAASEPPDTVALFPDSPSAYWGPPLAPALAGKIENKATVFSEHQETGTKQAPKARTVSNGSVKPSRI